MSCIDAACYRKKYPTVFFLLQQGVPTQKIRERHEYFLKAYPGEVILKDERIEKIMDFFDNFMPRLENYHLVRNLQMAHPTVEPKHPELKKYSNVLKNMVSKHYESVLTNYVTS